MAFDDAISFLSNYREKRAHALNNETRQPWSTQPLEAVGDFHETIFNSDQENQTWQEAYNQDIAITATSGGTFTDLRKMQGLRLKIAFLAGCRRDAAIMFEAWSDRRLKVPLDHDRFEMMRTNSLRQKTDKMKQIIQTLQDAGGSSGGATS